MSLDLAWDELNDALAQRLVDILNKQLATVSRPSFIGPVEITGLDFGTVCPDVEVVDMRDIYRDFLEDDEDNDAADGEHGRKGQGKEGGNVKGEVELEEEEYEWIPRRNAELAAAYDSPTYHQLPPYMRYDRMAASVPNLADLRPGLGFRSFQGFHASGLGMASSIYSPHTPPLNAPSPETSFGDRASPVPNGSASPAGAPSMQASASSLSSSNSSPTPVPNPNTSTHPNIQLHLRVLHHSDLRLSLTTSLLINYPSPMFLALPIKLAVTGLEFTGEVVVAYEGASSPRRVHFCLLDDLDPYGLATSVKPDESSRDGAEPAAKPLPVGQRLLPSIFIESEIGQADKHVLKNVTRVERFIQDVIRKTVEDELVFPNFHTIVLGE